MLKLLFLTHRYLGIGLGLLVLLWTLSGIVMMYKPYPELSEGERLALLSPLSLESCCSLPEELLTATTAATEFSIEMLGKRPLLILDGQAGGRRVFDLRSAQEQRGIDYTRARRIAQEQAERLALPRPEFLGMIHNDQWTVYGAYNAHRPLYHFAANDAARTEWYLSSRTGELLQMTTRSERVWGYLGAVVHWLYPTLLRERAELWSQTVIWLSLLSLLLVSTGMYFGLKQFRRRTGRTSPYRGFSRWHHLGGIVFGVLAFTWLFSGLLSMQPLGILSGSSAGPQQTLLSGGPVHGDDLARVLASLALLPLTESSVRLEVRTFQGEPFMLLHDSEGRFQRFTVDGQPLALSAEALASVATLLGQGRSVTTTRLDNGDSYYYAHHEPVVLPALRVIVDDEQQTRYYLHPGTGDLLRKVDSAQRWYRWLFNALHRLDFSAVLRSRPLWDLLLWSLLLGVALISATGVVLGTRRLLRR